MRAQGRTPAPPTPAPKRCFAASPMSGRASPSAATSTSRPSAPGSEARQSLRGLIEGPAPRSICGRGSRSTPTRCARSTARPPEQLDENLLFYLLSRGIDRGTARALLKWAFLGDVLRAIELPQLRARGRARRGRPAAGRHGDRSPDMSQSTAAAEPAPLDAAPGIRRRRGCAPISRSWRARSMASRWCTSTAPRPRSARCAVLRAVEHYETSSARQRASRRALAEPMGHRRPSRARARRVRRFLNARSTREIVFVRGTTEAINLVANSWGRGHLQRRR